MEEISGGVVGSSTWLDSGVGFCLVDSAFGLESAISARVLQLHTPSMRLCTRLKSPDSISKILESFGCLLTFWACLLESTFLFGALFSVIARHCVAVAWQSVASLENKGYRSALADVSLESIHSAPAE